MLAIQLDMFVNCDDTCLIYWWGFRYSIIILVYFYHYISW